MERDAARDFSLHVVEEHACFPNLGRSEAQQLNMLGSHLDGLSSTRTQNLQSPLRARSHARAAADLQHASGFAYLNYIDDRLDDWARAYYGDNLTRLRAIKARVDPSGFFRFPQGIPRRV